MYNCTKDIWETFQFVLLDAIGITFVELPVSCLILLFEVSPNHLCVVFNFSSDWCEGKAFSLAYGNWRNSWLVCLTCSPAEVLFSPILKAFEPVIGISTWCSNIFQQQKLLNSYEMTNSKELFAWIPSSQSQAQKYWFWYIVNDRPNAQFLQVCEIHVPHFTGKCGHHGTLHTTQLKKHIVW